MAWACAHELVAQGYPGSRMTVERFLQDLRAWEQQSLPLSVVTPETVELRPRRAIGLMLRRCEDSTMEEAATLERACQVHRHIQQTQLLLQELASRLRERHGANAGAVDGNGFPLWYQYGVYKGSVALCVMATNPSEQVLICFPFATPVIKIA
jgi:hypothetical protein